MMIEHPIPFAALDGKVGVMGVTGSGKTFTAIGLTEQLLEAGRQTIIIDPTGVYNGLRTAFPIPIFGGKFGDIPISDADGAAIARLIIDQNLSAIVDVSLLLKESHAAARRFMAGFVAVLKTAETKARYIVMDEADEFMPENASGSVTQLFGDLKWIVRRGRSEGWRMLMVTQRPQDIAKSVLTQCETMVIHKLTSPQDRKALQEWVKGTADAEQAKVVLDSMAKLATGEAWVWSPVHDLLERVQMPLNRSEDRSKTPDADDAPRATLGFQDIDLDALRAVMSVSPKDIVIASDINDPMTAWRNDVQFADKADRAQRDARENSQSDVKAMADLIDRAALLEQQLREMETRALTAEDLLSQFISAAGIVEKGIGSIYEEIRGTVESFGFVDAVRFGASQHLEQHGWEKPSEVPAQGGGVGGRDDLQTGEIGTLSKSAGKMLDVLQAVTPRPLTMKQCAILAGVSPKSSALRRYWAELADSNETNDRGDGKLDAIRSNGAPRLNPVELWAGMLTPPQAKLLKAVAAHGPITKPQAAAMAGISPTSSALPKALKDLQGYGLIKLGAHQKYQLSDDMRVG